MTPFEPALALALDLVGVFAFAVSGALVAVRRGLDLVGVLVLAWLTGLGGGTIRDVLIGAVPPMGASDWRMITAAVLGGLVTFALHTGMHRVQRPIRLLDALGLAFFCVSGTLVATRAEVGPVTAVIVGTVSAVGGGVLRDVVAGQVPELLRRELYALPALLGATLTALAHEHGLVSPQTVWPIIGVVFGIRIASIVFDWHLPQALTTGDAR
ncbi:trimeric intracellular cation channel family protein [Kytococcus schroeteri]|uniref:trimeric intracellular cation channel family protein n=1 Tax=Kytococcus schroeteri TaxID=138300 RepID=UPI0011421AC1|nr:trimeric intracellular cation channel family protein [Kytococcus schroeteri]